VLLQLTPEQAKLSEAQKKAAKDALGQKALDFALAFQPAPSDSSTSTPPPPDFITEASKRGLNPATTDFFAADTPPAGMAPSPSFNNAAFSLTKDNTTSKVVELDNGVAVLHLNAIQGSELRPLAEVKDAIEAKLKENSASRTARFAAQITAKLLQGSVKKGMDFKTAVASHKELKLETIPAFVPAKTPPSDERLQTIAEATISLKAGDVSEPVTVQSDNTLLIIHLDSRAPADPAGLADFEKRFRGSQDQQLQTLVQQDWANWKSKQPGTHRPPDLELYGSVE
jgi:parvulin-like peptidyl-prolyl isomerase